MGNFDFIYENVFPLLQKYIGIHFSLLAIHGKQQRCQFFDRVVERFHVHAYGRVISSSWNFKCWGKQYLYQTKLVGEERAAEAEQQ